MKLKLMEVSQQLRYLNEDDVKKGILSAYIQDYCYILHNKDKKEDGTDKEEHWHIYLKLKDSTDTKYIAHAFNVKEQYVNKVKGRWGDCLLYATHKNAPEKFQYSDEEVFSNFDFVEERNKYESKKKTGFALSNIIDKIDSGEIREYNITDYISMSDYVKYERQISRAFDYRTKKMKKTHRDMECIYIQGASGAGKTTYAKRIAEEKGYSYYISSGSNDILSDYRGEDCVILDDLRPSCLGLSDLLKMLDNNTSSSVKSRYKNKVLECKLIIITTTLSIENFFKNVFSEEIESAVQLYRRCSVMIKMELDTMSLYSFNNNTRTYDYLYSVANPVEFVAKERNRKETEEFVENLLGKTIEGFQKFVKLEPFENDDPFGLEASEPEQVSLTDYVNREIEFNGE